MARLTAKDRKALPKSEFGEPSKRAYPMPDRSHAANAKARATQAVKSGRMSKAEEEKIDRKASLVLERGRGHESHERPKHSAEARHGTEKTMLKTRGVSERNAHAKREHTRHVEKLEEPRGAKKRVAAEHKGEAKAHERKGEERHERKMEHHKAVERRDDKREEHKKAEHKAVERKDHKREEHREHEGRKGAVHERGEREKAAEKKHGGAKAIHHHHWH